MLHRVLARSVAITLIACSGAMLAGCPNGTNGPFPDPTVVVTDRAIVHGTIGDGIRKFSGIPYAAPPTGPNRFRAPQLPPALLSLFEATKLGNACPQSPVFGHNQTSEDCLTLNVTTPHPVGSNLPVMVWIHGGGFIFGAGADVDVTNAVKTGNIVVVTLNYRLGLLGFLAASALDDGSESTGHTGNYGIADQQFALKWVNRNIKSFGGDPANVTIAGESAGAFSVCAHLVSPGSAGLFHRAIVQSGPCAHPYDTVAKKKQYAAGDQIAQKLNCTGTDAQVATCLRSTALPVSAFLAAQANFAIKLGPSVGGTDIPDQPVTGLGHVPLLLGGTQLEAGVFITKPYPTKDTYGPLITILFPMTHDTVLTLYPYANYSSGFVAIATVLTDNLDFAPISPCYNAASWLKAAPLNPVYAYEFSEPVPQVVPSFPGGPLHATELPYLFPPPGGPPSDPALSSAMIRYWTNFVRSGDPNVSGMPMSPPLAPWPPFKKNQDVLQLGPSIQPVDVYATHNCAFWNGFPH